MKKTNVRITGVNASSVAVFESTIWGIVGLFVAIFHSFDTTVKLADSTDSVLTGMAFGIASGIVSIIVVPLIYSGIGWVIGYIHGLAFNVIAKNSGGIEVSTQQVD